MGATVSFNLNASKFEQKTYKFHSEKCSLKIKKSVKKKKKKMSIKNKLKYKFFYTAIKTRTVIDSYKISIPKYCYS